MTENQARSSSRACADGTYTVSRSKRKMHNDKDASGLKYDKPRTKKAKDSSQCLSVIDDTEVCRYLHNKNEMQLKKIIWEIMNKNHVKVERKRPVKAKKACPAKELVKIDTKEENKKRLSSKINFDVLEKLNEELDDNSEKAKEEFLDSDRGNDGDMQQIDRTVSAEVCSSGETESDDECEIGSEYNEEQDTNREYYEDEDQGSEGEFYLEDY